MLKHIARAHDELVKAIADLMRDWKPVPTPPIDAIHGRTDRAGTGSRILPWDLA